MSSDWSSLFCLNVGWPKIPRELQFHAQEYHVWQLWGLGTLRKDLAQTVGRIDASRKKESNEEVKLWMTGSSLRRAVTAPQSITWHIETVSPWASHKLEVTHLED